MSNKVEQTDNRAGGDIVGGDKYTNIYYDNSRLEDLEQDRGVLGEIFDHVINQANNTDTSSTPSRDFDILHVKKKILLNFGQENISEISEYYRFALTKIDVIENKFQSLNEGDQSDIQSYILCKYLSYKSSSEMNNMEILKALFSDFTPAHKKENPKYQNIARAVVLYFFEFCTIFERTKSEKSAQTNLFEDGNT